MSVIAALALALGLSARAQAPVSSLEIARCSLASMQECFDALQCGLPPADRGAVSLLADGSVLVDAVHVSTSINFRALRSVARSKKGRTRLLLLKPEDEYPLRTTRCSPGCEPTPTSAPMGHPSRDDGFMGYTFFPYFGAREDGIIYSLGPETDVVVQLIQRRSALSGTIHHELRHVVAGDFGHAATKAKHSEPGMTEATDAAEREAEAYCRTPAR